MTKRAEAWIRSSKDGQFPQLFGRETVIAAFEAGVALSKSDAMTALEYVSAQEPQPDLLPGRLLFTRQQMVDAYKAGAISCRA